MQSETAKPFLQVQGKMIILRTLEAVSLMRGVVEIVLALPPGEFDGLVAEYGDLLRRGGVTTIVPGGASRQQSVALGLAALKQASELVVAELSKDLTGIPDHELPAHLEKILPI